MKKALKAIPGVVGGVFLLLLLAFLYIFFGAYSPAPRETEEVSCKADAPELTSGQKIKVLVWNVQYMASKNYVFFYDLPGDAGEHERPSPQHIKETIKNVAQIIKEEKPDVVLLQELHEGASATDGMDQLLKLQEALGASPYPCQSDSFYWRAPFVPHPRIMGSAGMKLATLSKYRMSGAIRHALPPQPADPISTRLGLHRAVLAAEFPIKGGDKKFVALNTHLDAFAAGSDHMVNQVQKLSDILKIYKDRGNAWLLGGDFNLLPPKFELKRLYKDAQTFYNPQTEITPLFEKYQSTVSAGELAGERAKPYFTYNSNNPNIPAPDRTIDYIFYSRLLNLNSYKVRQAGTLSISDHLPLIAEVTIP